MARENSNFSINFIPFEDNCRQLQGKVVDLQQFYEIWFYEIGHEILGWWGGRVPREVWTLIWSANERVKIMKWAETLQMWGAHVEIGFLYFYQETHETENWEMNNSASENRICFGIHPFSDWGVKREREKIESLMVIQWSKNGLCPIGESTRACAHQLGINCLSAYIWICGFVIHRICAFVICGICHRCRQDRFWATESAKVNVAKNWKYKLFQHSFKKQ